MNERVREFLEELRDNWDDHYWWMRHLFLLTTITSILSGLLGLAFAWLETRIRRTGLEAT